jgi:hypothetical protein
MSRKVRSLLALVVLTLFLGTGAAHALPLGGRDADQGPGMLVAVWEWVASLLGAEPSYRPAHEAVIISPPSGTNGSSGCEHGGYIDPNGCPSGGVN